jgi:hypothetical protein
MEALKGGEDVVAKMFVDRGILTTPITAMGSLEEVPFNIAWTNFKGVIVYTSAMDFYRSHHITTEETTFR